MTKIKSNITEATNVTEAGKAHPMDMSAEQEALVERTNPDRGTVTPEKIIAAVSNAIGAIGDAFYEAEMRVRGDNGKLFRMDTELPDGVEQLAIEEVNTISYIQRQLCSVLPWKIETMLASCKAAQVDARRQLGWARGQVAEGKADAWLAESKARYVEQLEFQQAILETAFGAALTSYQDATGETFVTQAERETQRIRKAAELGRKAEGLVTESRADRFRKVA